MPAKRSVMLLLERRSARDAVPDNKPFHDIESRRTDSCRRAPPMLRHT